MTHATPTQAPPNGDLAPVTRALISVSDKTGLEDLGRALVELGVELLSTGGSARSLTAAGLPVTEVSAHTGFPEIMDGRVKTLHPTIHGGILARRDLEDHKTRPWPSTASRRSIWWWSTSTPFARPWPLAPTSRTCVENIDIGGPALIRAAAAKNHGFVAVVTDPATTAPWSRS